MFKIHPPEAMKHLADKLGWLNQLLGEDFWQQLQDGVGGLPHAAATGRPPGAVPGRPAVHQGASHPPTEVYTTHTEVVVAALLPGLVGPDQVQFHLISPSELVLEAFLPPPEPGAIAMIRERPSGYCVRSIVLPRPVKPEGARASYVNGVLEIRMYLAQPEASMAEVTLLRPGGTP